MSHRDGKTPGSSFFWSFFSGLLEKQHKFITKLVFQISRERRRCILHDSERSRSRRIEFAPLKTERDNRVVRVASLPTEDRVLAGVFPSGIRTNQCSIVIIFDQRLKFFAECSPFLAEKRVLINQTSSVSLSYRLAFGRLQQVFVEKINLQVGKGFTEASIDLIVKASQMEFLRIDGTKQLMRMERKLAGRINRGTRILWSRSLPAGRLSLPIVLRGLTRRGSPMIQFDIDGSHGLHHWHSLLPIRTGAKHRVPVRHSDPKQLTGTASSLVKRLVRVKSLVKWIVPDREGSVCWPSGEEISTAMKHRIDPVIEQQTHARHLDDIYYFPLLFSITWRSLIYQTTRERNEYVHEHRIEMSEQQI